MRPIAFCLMVMTILSGCKQDGRGVLSVTGQIEGIYVDAGSRIGGRIAEVKVREGDAVRPGDVLVAIEADEAEAALQAARAKVAQAQATVEKLKTGATEEQLRQAEAAFAQAEQQYQMALNGARTQEIGAAQAMASAAKAARDQTLSDYQRMKRLYEQNVISAQRLDQARNAYEAAEAQYRAGLEQSNLVESGARNEEIAMARAARDRAKASLDEVRRGPREEDIRVAEAAVEAAKADVARAESALKEMVVAAPRDGVVETIDVHPGDLVKPGPIVRIVDPEDLELMVYVGAGILGYLRLNQEVTITTDSLGDETFTGSIVQIAQQGEFTPRNLQTEEERVQQVFGVKIALNSNGGKLKAGMTATVHLPLVHEE